MTVTQERLPELLHSESAQPFIGTCNDTACWSCHGLVPVSFEQCLL
jgi:hypothetical protein